MMDLKDIIKWFIPCFHILQILKMKPEVKLTVICLFLFFNLCSSFEAKVNSDSDLDINKNSFIDNTKKLEYDLGNNGVGYDFNQSAFSELVRNATKEEEIRSLDDVSLGRTFGRPLKKMMQALIPLAFQIGAASTWAVVAALVGVKTLAVTLLILKLLLVAGAAKIGALFGDKGHGHGHGWEPPHQKEIHLHIHNGQHGGHEEHHSPWDKVGTHSSESKNINVVYDPHIAGPQTISTPYGHYVKIEPSSSTS